MNKAIEIIRDYMKIVTTVSTKYHVSECKEAIAELQAHKAKIESLKELCSEKSKMLDDVVTKTKYRTLAVKAASNKAIYDVILQKLEELDK